MMKKRVALLLTLVLLAVQAGCIHVSISDGDVEVLSGWDDLGASAVIGGGSTAADGIERLEIVWVAGSVRVEAGESDEIEIEETAGSSPIDSGMQLRYRVQNGTLRILFCKPGLRVVSVPEKDLTVRVPQALAASIRSLKLDTVSAQATVTGLSGKTLEVDTVSGDTEVRGGVFREIDGDSVSGDLSVMTASLPEELDFNSVSGGLAVALPAENDGFTLRLDSVSGEVDCALPVQVKGDDYIHGGGACRIDCDTVSGDVTIGEP